MSVFMITVRSTTGTVVSEGWMDRKDLRAVHMAARNLAKFNLESGQSMIVCDDHVDGKGSACESLITFTMGTDGVVTFTRPAVVESKATVKVVKIAAKTAAKKAAASSANTYPKQGGNALRNAHKAAAAMKRTARKAA
jgi:hypothetical protein